MLEILKPLYNALLLPFAKFLARLHIKPNTITLLGLLMSLLAAWYAAQGRWLLAALFMVVGSCMDGLDGVLARYAGKKTSFGAIFDSTADRLTEIFWLFGILYYYVHHPVFGNWGVYLSFVAISGSLMVSYVRARCEGVNIPCKTGVLQRPERIVILMLCFLVGPKSMVGGLGVLSAFAAITVVQRMIVAYTACKKNEQL
jgi:CDP-diacylglycerol---glycerol-3-phosphate 3-phosphatidyltransferase